MCSLEVRENVPVEMWLNYGACKFHCRTGLERQCDGPPGRPSGGLQANWLGTCSQPRGSQSAVVEALVRCLGQTDGTGPPLFSATAAWRERGCRRRQGRSLLTATGPVGVGVAAYRIPHSSCDDAPIAPPVSQCGDTHGSTANARPSSRGRALPIPLTAAAAARPSAH